MVLLIFANMFMARANRIAEMVQPGMTPTSNLCLSDIVDPAESVILKLLL